MKSVMKKIFKQSHRGRLHRALHVPMGEKIPSSKIEKALHSSNSHVRHMAEAAQIGKHISEGNAGEGM